MDINRNHYFLAGLVLLLIGIQLRMVDSYVLSPKTTQILAKRSGETKVEQQATFAAAKVTTARKVVRPPHWTGWCLMSIGSVLILHALAMRRPD